MDRNLTERLKKLSRELADAKHELTVTKGFGFVEGDAAIDELQERIEDIQDEIWDVEDLIREDAESEYGESGDWN